MPWEPRPKGAPLPAEDRGSFAARCAIRERERQLGTGYGFGIFVGGRFAGEITLSSIQRGPFQSGFIGYWIDQAMAGQGYVPEAVVMALALRLRGDRAAPGRDLDHPAQPGQPAGGREAGLRMEGVAERFLEIDGAWEDHARFAMTTEEWESAGATCSGSGWAGAERPVAPGAGPQSPEWTTERECRKNCSTSCS